MPGLNQNNHFPQAHLKIMIFAPIYMFKLPRTDDMLDHIAIMFVELLSFIGFSFLTMLSTLSPPLFFLSQCLAVIWAQNVFFPYRYLYFFIRGVMKDLNFNLFSIKYHPEILF